MSEPIQNAAGRAAGFSKLLGAMLAGGSAEAVKGAQPLIDDARPEDLVAAVDEAVARGVDSTLLKPAVSKLVNLLATPLKKHRCAPQAGERLFSSLMAENAGLLAVLERGKTLAKALNDASEDFPKLRDTLVALKCLIVELGAVEIHYRKKENVLFPWFEARYPEYRCVRLMWEIQDDVRRGLKDIAGLLDEALASASTFDPKPLNQAIGRLYFDLNANVFREECALFPVMLDLIGAVDREGLFAEAREFGWAFMDRSTIGRFEEARHSAAAANAARSQPEAPGASHDSLSDGLASVTGGFSGRTGAIPNQALVSMFAALPVDMTYVDADDKVRWFSDSPHRIFPRSPAIIGRDVRNCHPGASVGRVVAIVESFKRGEKDREAFWITMNGRFIHIEYFALRSPEGSYLGVLEASQDLTEKRALTGQKRLAD
ncbi:MAG: hypothetical protein A2Y38_23600 [Spirochaetes bacterium GWB1_59_5]|nr:MAG: hypothetical protein A2Y38_23600 [Spirochaetes bacterium GWB1_59_5]